MSISRVLVANRGEIARRVFTTCRRLGIGTVAVFSDADAGLPFVGEADVAVRLPGSTPSETYLRADLVIEAARKAGADAIHPGYGFLSENAGFARAVVAAGLTWIGPTAESIDAMGSKVAAKKLMGDAGVPVFAELDPAAVTEADLPILVKASAGGGGRGMRVVRDLADLAGQVQLASDEAASAFGDPTVFCEPYLENGRHVEVQVVGDTHGNVLVLGERDCSLQRRHQKVVEEAPAPLLSDDVRQRLHDGARLAARAIGYVGAGTVEFMVSTGSTSGESRVSFLEMNTRLQVEHPVTEAVFGVDLVEAQLRVAEGGTVPAAPTHPRGHAVEVRLYAEDPAADYQPQSGRLDTFEVPADLEFDQLLTYGTRLDSGFATGSEVGTHYDAMLAKVIAWGPDRASAFRSLAGVLERSRIHGLVTNRDLLVRLLRDEKVLAGEVSTDFLGTFDLSAAPADPYAAAAAALALAERDRAARVVQRAIPVGWRNVVSQPQRTVLATPADDEVEVLWHGGRDGYRLDGGGVTVLAAAPDRVVLEVDGVQVGYDVVLAGEAGTSTVHVDSGRGSASYRVVPRFVDPADQVSAGSLLAPMPGTVIATPVESGSAVTAGQTVVVLEAMKMQHTISAPADGVLDVAVAVGQQVAAGDVLAVVQVPDPGAEGEQA
ncbi:ATP-binding protein [Marmoricola sp. RAF53]|uniref:acetyl/propionyl/methylcrotonyl-CoA carboxylase subunit alpha n=1 Tax=Marmoricola sp. RAF53 TaxID=3233059 RepID=UPI003F96C28A